MARVTSARARWWHEVSSSSGGRVRAPRNGRYRSIAPAARRPSSSSARRSSLSTSWSSAAFTPSAPAICPIASAGRAEFVGADAAEEIAQIQGDSAVIDARIARLEDLLRTAIVLPEGPADGVATLGCTVEVEYERTGRRASYRLSGIAAGGAARSVSARSPVGRALMGRRAGDVVSVALPSGRVESLQIVAITSPPAVDAA